MAGAENGQRLSAQRSLQQGSEGQSGVAELPCGKREGPGVPTEAVGLRSWNS